MSSFTAVRAATIVADVESEVIDASASAFLLAASRAAARLLASTYCAKADLNFWTIASSSGEVSNGSYAFASETYSARAFSRAALVVAEHSDVRQDGITRSFLRTSLMADSIATKWPMEGT